ncbi:glutamine--fructose-6-phosphate transaminase (isomerizing) [Mucilaginibacter panaciglaebae]|uniref:Glutamine--fructose-6-phosphate aminotransferase [isomerizing] n=1 Tax=Mucilaginibacter panaciglaebae TaxID=502331 RepID=A0ABP7WEE5_9SPHI
MCGIVGYIGFREAIPVLLKGLKRLEYRGYDSAGIAVINRQLAVYKKCGKVANLELVCGEASLNSTIGIGHTRWATHGAPNDVNSHPHCSGSGKLAIVHNGIFENYLVIREGLIKKGHIFESETDTEVIIHLIEDVKRLLHVPLQEAVRLALRQVMGTYAIVIINEENPGELIAARKSSPLAIGVGEQEYFIASDATAIVEFAKNIIYLDDHQIARITYDSLHVVDIDNHEQKPHICELEIELDFIEKSGYEHFMFKEIFEQPQSIKNCMQCRLDTERALVTFDELEDYKTEIINARRIIIVSCGTSWHAGLIGEYFIEKYGELSVEVEYASEFRYRSPIINRGDIVLAISQSGETADTLAATELAKAEGALVLCICNVVGASIPRASHATMYTNAGIEIGVASTKAFSSQVTVLALLSLYIGQIKEKIQPQTAAGLLTELSKLPSVIRKTLQCADTMQFIATELHNFYNCLFLGRGVAFPVALEGALKLKEISYIHAEGYPAAEMKHGPIALIDDKMPVIFIAANNDSYEKIINNIQEVKARKGMVIAIVAEDDTEIKKMADFIVEVPQVNDLMMPIISTIPLQLLAYYSALLRNCDVDQPRNLAKSVTVE